MILEPGTFRVAEYRKPIPCAVKVQVHIDAWVKLIEQLMNGLLRPADITLFRDASAIQYDHDPALTNRPYDTEAGDFIPRQHDPKHIVARGIREHLEKTTGRKHDAEKTVTTRGSDLGERSRTQDIKASEAVHRARIAVKSGLQAEADQILSTVRFKKKHLKPKQKIPGRANPWPKRSWK